MANVRAITDEQGRAMLITFIEQHKLPMTVEITAGKLRTTRSNRLQRQWMNDISSQLGESAEYWRGFCKLTIGVPIRKAGSEAFAEAYDRDIRPLPYELKLRLMMAPIDFPVTREFRSNQMTEYLDSIQREFGGRGLILTDPDPLMQTGKRTK